MAIPQLTKDDILRALKYIDENGVPSKHQSTTYNLVSDDLKVYPPKYVIAVADHLVNGNEIATDKYNAVEATSFLKNRGFIVVESGEYVLMLTADRAKSTDSRFTMDDLTLGDHYKTVDVYMERANGQKITRKYVKNERRRCNQTMSRIMCQVFEKELDALSDADKKDFPICQYKPGTYIFRGIFASENEFRQYRKTREFCKYDYGNGQHFVYYCWNIFSTIMFVQECLKRYGNSGDKVILIYREKGKDEDKSPSPEEIEALQQVETPSSSNYKNPYSSQLLDAKNIIFRGAPGTGKTYLAKKVAADIVSGGLVEKYDNLTVEQKQQIEFVQFHSSYDYTDFVEGLRPKINDNGSMEFELRDGIFKEFVARAVKNYENSKKSPTAIEKDLSVQQALSDFFSNVQLGIDTFKTVNGSVFTITSFDRSFASISIPGNANVNKLRLNLSVIRQMLESDVNFNSVKDIKEFFGTSYYLQDYSYDFVIYNEIKAKKNVQPPKEAKQEKLKNYVFIIDEINRGEISKIFGELFFSVDPGYRGKAGEVSTQYANLHADPNEKFYIPDNVYIIGTMNDIDRSVESFDFAMRRRFRFIEIKAVAHLEMLDSLGSQLKAEAIARMTALNRAIVNEVPDLNENYQIGAAYFMKLEKLTFDQLWTDYLKPLLQEYIRGMYDEKGIMSKLEKAYGYNMPNEGDANDDVQGQG